MRTIEDVNDLLKDYPRTNEYIPGNDNWLFATEYQGYVEDEVICNDMYKAVSALIENNKDQKLHVRVEPEISMLNGLKLAYVRILRGGK